MCGCFEADQEFELESTSSKASSGSMAYNCVNSAALAALCLWDVICHIQLLLEQP